jgi:hypothetical protein
MTWRRLFEIACLEVRVVLKHISVRCTPFLNTQQTVEEHAQDVARLDCVLRELDEDDD